MRKVPLRILEIGSKLFSQDEEPVWYQLFKNMTMTRLIYMFDIFNI